MIYLNNAATSYPKSQAVLSAVAACLAQPALDSSRGESDGAVTDQIESSRQLIAAFIGCSDPSNVVFTSGATESLNLVIAGLDLAGAHVITTEAEHTSMLRPLYRLQKKGIISLSIVPCRSCEPVTAADISPYLLNNTRLIAVTQCSNVTGAIASIKPISSLAHDAGAMLLVDGSQSVGNIPVHVEELDVDFFAFAGHKALGGMQGCGGLYVRKGICLEPLKVGGSGIMSDLHDMPPLCPLKYEAGTRNLPGIVSMAAGVRWILETGFDTILLKKKSQIDTIIRTVAGLDRIRLHIPECQDLFAAGILSFTVTGMESDDVGYVLNQSFGIMVRSGLHCAPLIHRSLGTLPAGCVRISLSFHTTDDEIQQLIIALRSICK